MSSSSIPCLWTLARITGSNPSSYLDIVALSRGTSRFRRRLLSGPDSGRVQCPNIGSLNTPVGRPSGVGLAGGPARGSGGGSLDRRRSLSSAATACRPRSACSRPHRGRTTRCARNRDRRTRTVRCLRPGVVDLVDVLFRLDRTEAVHLLERCYLYPILLVRIVMFRLCLTLLVAFDILRTY